MLVDRAWTGRKETGRHPELEGRSIFIVWFLQEVNFQKQSKLSQQRQSNFGALVR